MVLFFILPGIIPAQRTKIDSLKKKLPELKGAEKLNCLNTLSLAYTYLNTDSAKAFAQEALDESARWQNDKAMVIALNNKAHIAGVDMHNFLLQEQICRQALAVSNRLHDKKMIADTYLNLALAFFSKGDFENAVKTCDTVIRLAQFNDIKKELGEAIAIKGSADFEIGNYGNSFACFNQSLKIFNSINDSYNIAIILAKIGDLYRLAGDRAAALNFYFQSLEYPKADYFTWHPLVDLGDTYYLGSQSDSSLYESDEYLQSIKSMTIRSSYSDLPDALKAENEIAERNFSGALTILIKNVKLAELNNNKTEMMRLLLDMAKAYSGEKNFKKAFYYARQLLQDASVQKAKQYLRDGYYVMFDIYERLKQTDSAYFYFKKYNRMKDSVALNEFAKKLAIHQAAIENEKKKVQIDILNKEKLISQQQLQISNQQLKSESLVKKILIVGVGMLIIFGFIVFRNVTLQQKNETYKRSMVEKELAMQKLESEKINIALQQRATQLEIQALRAQMNPHFIFNCLNSINKLTLTNEPEKASDYLTKFAKLIRMVLQQSGKQLIPLEDELNCLRLYMDLEKNRFDVPFSYQIHCYGTLVQNIMVPNLVIQPFVENAIWHGLQPKKEGVGRIEIDVKHDNDTLFCSITDNGVGRSATAQQNSNGKSSLGIQLIKDRLQLLNTRGYAEPMVEIKDVVNENGKITGTCVELKIPVEII
ncbi:MAG TPA: histidine kinase [Puia sp.]|nr:histidine kinase [Puia sp.]